MTQLVMAHAQRSGAEISECGRYRYSLWREWGHGSEPKVAFLMCNPSIADALQDDATIRKCTGFAKRWGMGGLVVVNLFAYRATDPNALGALTMAEAVGPENKRALEFALNQVTKVVYAWGSCGNAKTKRLVAARVAGSWLAGFSTPPECFGWTADGRPKHPLMLGYDTALVMFEGPDCRNYPV